MCSILLVAIAVFGICLFAHVAMWRIYRPSAYRQWLPALVVIFLGLGPTVAWFLIRSGALAIGSPVDPLTAWVAALLLHGAASAVYIIGYTLVSAFSPSVEILKLLERSPDGLPRADV